MSRLIFALLLGLLGTGGVAPRRPLHIQGAADHISRRQLAQTTTTLDLTAVGSSAFSGKTPAIIGVNVGHRYPGSNWPIWMKRLGVNGARVFLSALWGSSLESFVGSTKWGKSLSGTAVTSLASFQAAVAELRTPAGRANPPSAQFISPVKWSTLDSKWATTDTSTKADEQEGSHNATCSTLQQILPNAPLVVIGCGMGSIRDSGVLDNTTAAYWASHWEVYKHFYAFSWYLWKRGITRIELYNEPDLDNDFQNADGTFKNALWVDQLALRSRAIQDLFADMNAEDTAGADLTPNIHVGAYAKTQYNEGKMGQPAVQAIHNTFAQALNPDPSYSNLQTYSYHSYGQSGKTILANFQELLANVTADRTASGVPFTFSVTEFNAKTSGDFSNSAYNMDTPSQAVKLGSQLLNYATSGTELTSIYIFKFSVTLSSSNGVAKNGIHWGDNTGAPYQIGDSSLAAEAVRLAADQLAGAKDILTLNSAAASSLTDIKSIAVLNNQGTAYCVYIVNTGTANIMASLQLSNWGISLGWPVLVERVNATSYGEVSEQLTTNSTGGVAVALPVENLVRLTIPATKPVLQNITAAATAHVRAGTNSALNYGTFTTMCVGTTNGTTHANTYATLMKFSVSNPAAVTSAVLRLRVSSLSAALSANMPLLLLGISSNDWTAGAVTWNSLAASSVLKQHPPAGSSSTWKVDSVANNFINWNAPGVQVVGHVTLPSGLTTSKASGTLKMVDVTSFVKQSSGTVSFVLVRPFRNNQEVATGNTIPADTLNGGANVCFHSASATTTANQPVLQMF